MYHHHHQQQQQQQQGPQAFPSGPRPSQNQPPIRPPADMMPPPGQYQFPRPTQLPDELESALSVRGSRDMDHRLIEHLDRLKQHQSQAGMSQHGNYGANLCDTQPKQSMDWSNYEPPAKLFGQHQGGQHPGTSLQNWNSPMSGSSVPPQREGGRGLYTPESAGTILASFGLSNEDLEALSHYPDDQLTPDTLPFILRDLQVHKKPKSSHSPEVPSLLTVTQTEGRVIDYGHASQAKDESGPPKTFKKEPISSERTVKMYPSPAPKLEGRQVRLEPAEPTKHGDRDYRRRSSEHHSSRSPPPRDFSTSAKPRHQDRDYRLEQPKPRASAEKRSAELTVSKSHPSPSAKPLRSGLKSPSNKKLPTPTMMSDFSGALPKVYPHTCSLCNMECEQEQEWLGHLGTVNHTAACRHLRTKYPEWKPKLPSRDYGKRPAAPHSASRSTSWSPPPPPPLDKRRGTSFKLRGRPYAPQHVTRPHPYHTKDVDARYDRPHGGATLRRPAFREHLEKRELTGTSRSYLKRPLFESKHYSSFKGDGRKKTTLSKSKSILKPGHGTKQAVEGPPAKKKKVAAHGLVYLTDIPKEATEQEVMNLARSFGRINNVLLMPSHEEEDKEHGQQASVCMMTAEDAQTFAKAPNLLIRDRVITATVAKSPEEQSSDADSSSKAEQGGAGDQSLNKKKGVVLIEDLPESGWTEENIKALAEPFGYPDNVIVAKQIRKALLIMPDIETAQEMVKVHTFSPASVNGHNVMVKNVYRNIGLHTPVALYNLLMHSVDGVVSAAKGSVGWVKIVVVSNVPQTPYGAFIVHKLVSRIGTVLKTLAVNDQVIFEMATGLLATAVYRHYAKFPCMIQNNPLVFSRKPDPKFPAKVIPAFLDADKDVPEQKKEAPPATTTESNQNETDANPEVKEEADPMEITTEVAAGAEEENPTATAAEEEPVEMKMEEVVNAESTEEVVKAEPVEEDQSSAVAPQENGAEVQSEEPKSAASTEGEAAAQNTASEASVAKAVSAERETPANAPKPSAPSAPTAQKRSSREKSRDVAKNSHRSSVSSGREDERRRSEWRDKESRDRERRERERSRKERDYDERSKRDYDRERRSDPRRDDAKRDEARRGEPRKDEMRRDDARRDDARRDDAKREEMKRAWRKEWERREGKRRPYSDTDRRSDGSRRSSHRDERHKRSSERRTLDDDFPFNLSDFVTVDEVGDVDSEAPETGPELGSDPGLELGSDSQTGLASDPKPELESDPKPGPETQTEESPESRPPQNLPQETEEKVEDISMEESAEDPQKGETQQLTEVQLEEQMAEEIKETAVPDDVTEEVQAAEITDETCPEAAEITDETCPEAAEIIDETCPEAAEIIDETCPEAAEIIDETCPEAAEIIDETCPEIIDETCPEAAEIIDETCPEAAEITDETCPDAAEENGETNQEEGTKPLQDTPEVTATTTAEEPLKEEASTTEKDKEEKRADATSAHPAEPEKSKNGEKDVAEKVVAENAQSDKTLPPFDANRSIGLEYLVPMTGFFCKVCTRFFTGAKDAQIGHSKTLKHYENLEKFLKTSSPDAAGST